MLVCALLLFMHTRPRVHRAPGIPARPLSLRVRQNNGKPRAVRAARTRTHVSTLLRPHVSQRHCEEPLRRSNPFLLPHSPRDGLLRGACHRAALCADPLARNDGCGLWKLNPTVIVRLDRTIQYAETPMMESRSRGVLDPPHSRRMTTVCEARSVLRARPFASRPPVVDPVLSRQQAARADRADHEVAGESGSTGEVIDRAVAPRGALHPRHPPMAK